MRANAQVTTTSGIDGWKVDSYLGVVASHVVAGTGFGSDIMAGFSDLFGGRSGAYQNQLASLYAEAIDQLHRKAQRLGGNWIVGLRVDIDEVSGKGMQMFMVTAMGTAVHAIPEASKGTPGPRTAAGVAAAPDVERMQRRLAIGRSARAKDLILDANTWEFIVDQKVEEAAPAVLTAMAKVQGEQGWQYVQDPTKQKALAYFQSLPPESASRILHEALCEDPPVSNVALGIMRELSLVNLPASLQGFRSTNLDLRRRIVQALAGHQQSYLQDDVALLDELAVELQRAFQGGPDVVRGKGLLGGKKERWVCDSCGHQNDVSDPMCGKCTRDMQGFRPGEVTADKLLALLRERREALHALFHVDQISPERQQLASDGGPAAQPSI